MNPNLLIKIIIMLKRLIRYLDFKARFSRLHREQRGMFQSLSVAQRKRITVSVSKVVNIKEIKTVRLKKPNRSERELNKIFSTAIQAAR